MKYYVSVGSNMHRRYVHFSGGESMDDVLKLKGIVKRSTNILSRNNAQIVANRIDLMLNFAINVTL